MENEVLSPGRWISRRPHEQAQQIYVQVYQALQKIRANFIPTIQYYERSNDKTDPWHLEIYNVYWSILILIEELADVPCIQTWIPPLSSESRSIAEAFRLFDRCPSVSKRAQLSASDAYRLLARIPPGCLEHTDCSYFSCKVFNISERTYKMQHAKSCKQVGCQIVRVCHEELNLLVEQDSILVINSEQSPQGRVKIDVRALSNSESYVAISHVWAGGLGNFTENGLYYCQLQQLHIDLSQKHILRPLFTSQKVCYWLDSLCIPAERGDLKTKAIDSMARIYAGASKVHVIDPELRDLDSKDLDLRSIDLALLCSPRMARSWTLQEGALAVNLQLKFRDGIVPFEVLDTRMGLSRNTPIQDIWSRDVDRIDHSNTIFSLTLFESTVYEMLRPEVTRSVEKAYKLPGIWNELRTRNTTKPEDLAAIVAVFLDRSAGEVLSLPASQRIHALLRIQEILPVWTLFLPTTLDSVDWRPEFPTCDQAFRKLDSTIGIMEFTEDDMFKITSLENVQVLQCHQDIHVAGGIFLHDTVNSQCTEIHFDNSKSQRLDVPESNVLFLFPPVGTDEHSYSRGLFLQTTADDEGMLQARLLGSFRFRSVVVHTSGTDHGCQNAVRSTGSSSDSRSSRHYMVTTPFDASYFTPEHPLMLDMRVSVWPRLSWSRPEFFTFIETSMRLAQPLHYFQYLMSLSVQYTMIHLVFVLLVWIVFKKAGFGTCILLIMSQVVVVSARIMLGNLESAFFRRSVNRRLQQKWAASFWPKPENTIDMASNLRRRPVIIALGLVHGLLLVVSVTRTWIIVMTQDHLWHEQSLSRIEQVILFILFPTTRTPSLAHETEKNICLTLLFELYTRVIALITFDRPHLWSDIGAEPLPRTSPLVPQTDAYLEAHPILSRPSFYVKALVTPLIAPLSLVLFFTGTTGESLNTRLFGLIGFLLTSSSLVVILRFIFGLRSTIIPPPLSIIFAVCFRRTVLFSRNMWTSERLGEVQLT